MKKINVSEATEPVLDWLVAKYEGWIKGDITHPKFCCLWRDQIRTPAAYPTTDWAQGGPIITREKISIRQWVDVPVVNAYMPNSDWSFDAASPLIAAMRCYVASKLGDEVEVPEELL